MHMCVKGNDFVSLCHFFLFVKCSDSVVFSWFLKCSDSVVFSWFLKCADSMVFFFDFWSVPTMWYFFDVFRQCGIFLIFEVFRQCGIFFIFLKCSDSVVFFLYFWSVSTVWYLFVFHFIVPYVEMQSLRLWNDICNSVVFTFTTDVDIFITFLGSLVLEGIIRKVAIASSLTWFIKYSTRIVEIYSH
jgi:hypothetical protein